MCRSFLISVATLVKLIFIYLKTIRRNFNEILRVIDSMQPTARHEAATHEWWMQGGDMIIVGSVCDDDARKLCPQGWNAPRPHLRIIAEPA